LLASPSRTPIFTWSKTTRDQSQTTVIQLLPAAVDQLDSVAVQLLVNIDFID
jgi:hypothetical protein